MSEPIIPGPEEDGLSLLAEEVRTWNTPLIGGYQLWQFTLGYCKSRTDGDAPIGLLHFIAGPILASPQLSETVTLRRKSLQSFAFGFEDKKQIDVLLGLQDRIRRRRHHTLAAIDAAICAGLLVWDPESGKLYPLEAPTASRGRNLRAALKREGDKAQILGAWFAAHDLSTIAAYLKVVL
ncbi:MAG: three component ABC system middle component [Pseudomonadota bacterium]